MTLMIDTNIVHSITTEWRTVQQKPQQTTTHQNVYSMYTRNLAQDLKIKVRVCVCVCTATHILNSLSDLMTRPLTRTVQINAVHAPRHQTQILQLNSRCKHVGSSVGWSDIQEQMLFLRWKTGRDGPDEQISFLFHKGKDTDLHANDRNKSVKCVR